MSSQSYPLRTSGIYRNLPSFDPNLKGLQAIICGATGISGFHTLRALLDQPHRWSKIYALSRSPLSEQQLALLTKEQVERVQHISIDLSKDGKQIAEQLKEAKVQADYGFYYTYIQPKKDKDGNKLSAMDPRMAEALVDANVEPFKNFLSALDLAGLRPKRILLQTGGKNYGVHIGLKHLSPNFYYPQERLLFDYCKHHPETAWNVIMPFAVVGAVPSASMNFFYSFGVYAAVQASKNEPLRFGGGFKEWVYECANSTARLTGYLSEWAVLEQQCANQRFNAHDGSPLSWDRFFHELARWYGVEKVQGPSSDDSEYNAKEMAGGEKAPLGYGPRLTLDLRFSLAEWADQPENAAAWKKLMDTNDGYLTTDPFAEDRSSVFIGDFGYTAFGAPSMNKVRRYGFSGFVDTLESVFEMYQEMAHYSMLPPLKASEARPMV